MKRTFAILLLLLFTISGNISFNASFVVVVFWGFRVFLVYYLGFLGVFFWFSDMHTSAIFVYFFGFIVSV